MNIFRFIGKAYDLFHRFLRKYIMMPFYKSLLGGCGEHVGLRSPGITGLSRVYMGNHTTLHPGFKMISFTGKLIMKEHAGAAIGLTVITGNHNRVLGKPLRSYGRSNRKEDVEKDVVIEEDVWIGANVTICAGVTIGRSANIGAGSVVRNNIPPYSIVMGNPAKVVGFCFTPKEIIEHEKVLYPEDKRLSNDLLEKNYRKFFLNRIKEIKEYTKL